MQHAPSYGTVKNWVAQFKRGEFSTSFGRPKTVTTPEIIDQIHELILEDLISAKSIAEQLGMSRERVGLSFMKIWTCGSSALNGSRNA